MTSSTLQTPLITRLVPLANPALRVVVQIALGVAFIAALAQLRIPMFPVPITGQTLGVLLVGSSFGLTLGGATLLTYLAVGALGLPLFAQGNAGLEYMLGGTGGYLLGFALAALLVGYLAQRGWDKSFASTALAMLLGNIVLYIPGLLWLNRFMPDWATTLQNGLTPFIVGDIIKLLIASAALPLAWKALGKR